MHAYTHATHTQHTHAHNRHAHTRAGTHLNTISKGINEYSTFHSRWLFFRSIRLSEKESLHKFTVDLEQIQVPKQESEEIRCLSEKRRLQSSDLSQEAEVFFVRRQMQYR